MPNDRNKFIKWLALKPFIINEINNATKIAFFSSFFCMNPIFSLVTSTLNSSKESLMELKRTREQVITKDFQKH